MKKTGKRCTNEESQASRSSIGLWLNVLDWLWSYQLEVLPSLDPIAIERSAPSAFEGDVHENETGTQGSA